MGLLDAARKVAGIAAPIVGGALGGPIGAAAGQAVGSAVAPKKPTGGFGGMPVGPHIVDPGPAPMPPVGATASSLAQARGQDKSRLRRQYGM